jgi:hypothetical protein
MDDRGHSVQSLRLARSSSSHLPSGTTSASSFPSLPPPAVIKKASSSMRHTKDTVPGESERRLGSSASYGRNHVDLSTALIAAPPQIYTSTSHFQQPNQHHTVSSESFASGHASPSLPGGVIRRTGSLHPHHRSDNDASRADGVNILDIAKLWGGLPLSLTKALPSPRDQPSNKNLVDCSARAERPFLSTPHDTMTLARENEETTDSASDGTTHKEGVCMSEMGDLRVLLISSLVSHSNSTTQGQSLKPTSPAAKRHGDNLHVPLPPFHSLAVRQNQVGQPPSSMAIPPRLPMENRTPTPEYRMEHRPMRNMRNIGTTSNMRVITGASGMHLLCTCVSDSVLNASYTDVHRSSEGFWSSWLHCCCCCCCCCCCRD